MANLATMQRYAEKCAEKLGVTDTVKLRWHGGECKLKKSAAAHCHVDHGDTPSRGTICIRKGTWRLQTVKGWHNLIAHEVAHLGTKSNHNSPAFARKMMALGQADRWDKNTINRERWLRHHRIRGHTKRA